MKLFRIVWKTIIYNFSSSALCILLSALGTAILCLVLLLSSQINRQISLNGSHVDLVVGAKGSPLQLILSSIFHVDYPTGNILLDDARKIAAHPLVKLAVPLSIGDNYQGFRIVGTDSRFLDLYGLHLVSGKWGASDFEAVIGHEVAKSEGLKCGDKIVGAHGLADSGDLHGDHPYTIVGILEESRSIADRLVLTNLSSVWHMHEHEHQHQEHQRQHQEKEEVHDLLNMNVQGREITSMLIRYKNPTAVAMFPRLVNQTTNMQAASPAIESARLFSMMGVGLDAASVLAVVLMLMAAISVFASLYNSFKNRKYELAIMRSMGAAKSVLFKLMLLEGMLITAMGAISGVLLAHIAALAIAVEEGGHFVDAYGFGIEEISVVLAALLLGFSAALIPAAKAYSTPISETLAK